MWSDFRSILGVIKKARRPGKASAGKKVGFRDIAFLFRLIKPFWKQWSLSIVLVLLTMAIKSLIPMGSKFLIDYLILNKNPAGLREFLTSAHIGFLYPAIGPLSGSAAFIAAVLLALGLAYGMLELLRSYTTMRSQQKFINTLQDRLFSHILSLPMAFFKNTRSGYLASRISGDIQILQYLFSQYLPRAIGDLAFFAASVFLLYGLSPGLTALLVATLPLYLLINAVFFSTIQALSRLDREVSARMAGDIQEVISGVEVVKCFGSERREADKLSDSMQYAMHIRIVSDFLISASQLFMKGAQFIIVIALLLAGAGQIRLGAMTPGDYIAFLSYVFMLSGTMNSLFYLSLVLQPIAVSVERIKELLATAPEFEPPARGKALIRPERLAGHVKFDGVSFSYEDGRDILRCISFEALPGDIVAIVGASGAGKTTVINLLLRFYHPRSGAIYMDSIDLRDIDPRWLRRQVSVISQDTFLFNDTVENNILYGRPGASRDDVVRAAAQAGIDEDIKKLPEAYGTMIGERGTKLSAGQRQRISMARAILKGSSIIIMDEPTSALDAVTEEFLRDSLHKLIKGKTTFIISHHASLTKLADKTLIIEDGMTLEK
jgi:ABC-type multidrug transport system fused ATPase/permease subunit